MMVPWIFFLKEDQQLLVESFTRRWVVNGPGVYLAMPGQRVRRREGITLGPTGYVLVRDRVTGELRNKVGPKLFLADANEEVVQEREAIPLQSNEYIRLVDRKTGVIRVERGENSVYLSPTEEKIEGVRQGVHIDEHTAAVVLDKRSGQQALVTEPQVFFPLPHQEVLETRRRILLEDHEAVVVKDQQGKHCIHRGEDGERSFFLGPYDELLRFRWSTGLHKDRRDLVLTHIDLRPKFMWYEFEARTQDNVELVLGITFFWQIVDPAAMVRTTDDTPGDVCSHARSSIIQAVSRVTLEGFLSSFNAVVHKAVLEMDDAFYKERGVKLHAVEVRSISCKDIETQQILQDIIRETTDRLNQLQKQESENEIRLKQINGEIEAQRMKRKLLEIQKENAERESMTAGAAQAIQVSAFFDGLGQDRTEAEKMALFQTLRKAEMLDSLSKGRAQLYFTPADVDLSIETKPA